MDLAMEALERLEKKGEALLAGGGAARGKLEGGKAAKDGRERSLEAMAESRVTESGPEGQSRRGGSKRGRGK